MKNGKTIVGMMVALVLVVSLSNLVVALDMGEGESYGTELVLDYMDSIPTIDGELSINEWTDATMVGVDVGFNHTELQNDTVYLYFGNDADYLYIAFDVTFAVNETDPMDITMAIDEDGDDTMEEHEFFLYGVSESWFNSTSPYNASVMASKPINWAKTWGESLNSENDHVVFEFAIPISAMDAELGDTINFMIGAETYETAETFLYPIDAGTLESEDSSDWAEITLAVGTSQAETGTATEYAIYMLMAGTFIVGVLLIFHKETVYKWIGDGNDKYFYASTGLSLGVSVFGLLQYYYDWIGSLGL